MIPTETRHIRPSFTVYMNNVLNTPYTGRCAEVGVSCGYNAYTMLSRTNINLVLVDDYLNYLERPDAYQVAKELLNPYQDRIRFITKPSVRAARKFDDGHFDYVYIDAGHTHEDVLSDIDAWWPKIRRGGMLAGHDSWKKEVNTAVMEYFKDKDTWVFGTITMTDKPVPANLASMCDWWVFKT